MIASFKRWFVCKRDDIIHTVSRHISSSINFVFKSADHQYSRRVVIEDLIALSIWRAITSISHLISTIDTHSKIRTSIKSSRFSTIFSRDDWFLIQIFRASRSFVKIRIVIVQWRRIWMSIHHRTFVYFEQFSSTISFVFSLTDNLLNKFWKLQLVSFFLFCLSSFYFRSQYDTSFSSKSFWLLSHHRSFALRLSYSITSIQLIQFILSIHRQKLLWTTS